MKKNYLLRLLTLAIYFLPFSFFYSGCEGVAYNKADAEKIKKEDSLQKEKNRKETISDSTLIVNDSSVADYNSANESYTNEITDTTSFKYKLNEIGQKIVERALLPTKESISAIGITQIFENMFGRVCIILSILLSFVLLIAERFLRHKNKLIRNLLFLNLICVIAFIVDGFIYKVELKYGVWCLLAVLILQLYLEIKRTVIKT